MNNDVSLQVNGVDYMGWLAVEISAGINRQARDFNLGITRSWPGAKDLPRKVRPHDACEVYIGSDKVLTGFVDATPISYDSESIAVSVTGRSKTADLVDCAANFGSGQWRGSKIESIAADLARPYGITVRSEVDTGPVVPDHQIDTGETAYESIGRLLTLRQLLSTDDADGNAVLINAGSGGNAGTSLVYGQNILSADSAQDYKDTFSAYVCKGQRAGNDQDYAATVAGVSAKVLDSNIKRFRLTIIELSGQATQLDCQQRANFERVSRAAKALETVYTVQGWRQGNGKLWVPNQMVRVTDPVIGLDVDLLIVEVTYSISDQGTIARLKVAPKSGYIPSPEATKKAKAGSGGNTWSDIQAAK